MSIVDRLERLAELLEMGALTPEEFAAEKQRLLGKSANADRTTNAVEVGSGTSINDEIEPEVRKIAISDLPERPVDQPNTSPSTNEPKSAAERGAASTPHGRSTGEPRVDYRASDAQTIAHVVGSEAQEHGGAGNFITPPEHNHDERHSVLRRTAVGLAAAVALVATLYTIQRFGAAIAFIFGICGLFAHWHANATANTQSRSLSIVAFIAAAALFVLAWGINSLVPAPNESSPADVSPKPASSPSCETLWKDAALSKCAALVVGYLGRADLAADESQEWIKKDAELRRSCSGWNTDGLDDIGQRALRRMNPAQPLDSLFPSCSDEIDIKWTSIGNR